MTRALLLGSIAVLSSLSAGTCHAQIELTDPATSDDLGVGESILFEGTIDLAIMSDVMDITVGFAYQKPDGTIIDIFQNTQTPFNAQGKFSWDSGEDTVQRVMPEVEGGYYFVYARVNYLDLNQVDHIAADVNKVTVSGP